jgi:hypothetical protein
MATGLRCRNNFWISKRPMGFDQFLKAAALLLGLQWRPFKERIRKGRPFAQLNWPVLKNTFSESADPEKKGICPKSCSHHIKVFRDLAVFAIRDSLLPYPESGEEDLRIG